MLSYIQNRFGKDVSVTINNYVKRVGNENVHGMFKNMAFTLSTLGEPGVEYHEAFHGFFTMYLTDGQRASLLKQAAQRYGEPSQVELDAVNGVRELALEEKMSNAFQEYSLTEDPKGIPAKIAKFFKDLWNLIKSMISDSIGINQAFSILESNNIPMKFKRNMHMFRGGKPAMYLKKRVDYTTQETKDTTLFIRSRFMNFWRSYQQQAKQDPFKVAINRQMDKVRTAFPAMTRSESLVKVLTSHTKNTFLRNAWSYTEKAEGKDAGTKIDLKQARELHGLRREGKTDEYMNKLSEYGIQERAAFGWSPNPGNRVRMDKTTTNFQHFIDIYENWGDTIQTAEITDDNGKKKEVKINTIDQGWWTGVEELLPDVGLKIRHREVTEGLEELPLDPTETDSPSPEGGERIYELSHYEQDSWKGMSKELRMYFEDILDYSSEIPNHLQVHRPHGGKHVYEVLKLALSNTTSFTQMKDVLKEKATLHGPNSIYGIMFSRVTGIGLEGRVENITMQLPATLVSDFHGLFRNTTKEFKSVKVNRSKRKDAQGMLPAPEVVVYNPDQNSIINNLVNNQYRKNIIDVTGVKTERALYNKAVTVEPGTKDQSIEYIPIRENLQDFQAHVKDLNSLTSMRGELNESELVEATRAFRKIVTYLGVDLPGISPQDQDTVLYDIVNQGVSIPNRFGKYTTYQGKNFFRYFLKGSKTKSKSNLLTVSAQIIDQKGEPKKPTFEPFSKGASRGLLMNLAAFQKALGINGEPNYVNEFGKSIYKINMPTAFDNTVNRIKSGKIFDADPNNIEYGNLDKDPLFVPVQKPVDGTSSWANYVSPLYMSMINNTDGLREKLSLENISAFTLDSNRGYSDFGQMSESDEYLLRLFLFQKGTHSDNLTNMMIDTQGDRGVSSTMGLPRVILEGEGTRSLDNSMYGSNGFKTLTDFSNAYIIQDIVKMQQADSHVELAEDGESLFDTYHYTNPSDKKAKDGKAFKFTQLPFAQDMLERGDLDLSPGINLTQINVEDFVNGEQSIRTNNYIETEQETVSRDKVIALLDKISMEFGKNIDRYTDQWVSDMKKMKVWDNNIWVDTDFLKKIHGGNAAINDITKKYLIKNYIVNDVINRLEMKKILRITDDFTNNTEIAAKRFGLGSTPGLQLLMKGQNLADPSWGMTPTFSELIIEDLYNIQADSGRHERFAESLNTLGVPLKLINQFASQYRPGQSNKTDASGWMSVHAWRNRLQGQPNGWTNAHEKAYNNYKQSGVWGFYKNIYNFKEGKTEQILVRPPVLPIKEYYESHELYQGNTLAVNNTKNSYLPLLKETTDIAGQGLELIRLRLEGKELNAADKAAGKTQFATHTPIDVANTVSAKKLARLNVIKFQNNDGTFNISGLVTAKPVVLNSNGIKIPQIKPSTATKKFTIWGTQVKRNAIANVQDDTQYTLPQGNKLSGSMVKSLYHKAAQANMDTSIEKLEKAFGFSRLKGLKLGDNGYDNAKLQHLKYIRDLIQREVIERGLPQSYIDSLEIVKDTKQGWKFQIPLDFPVYQRRFQNILYSSFRKTALRQKINGLQVVQMADVGGRDTQTLTSTDLKFIDINNGKITKAEILISEDIAARFGLKKGESLEMADPELLDMIGYRIPNQGKNSILALTVKGILPGHEATVVVPGEITTQMGSDFDIDALFLMIKNGQRNSQEAIDRGEPVVNKVSYPLEEMTGKAVANKSLTAYSKPQLDNLIIDLTQAIVTNVNHLQETITPLDPAEFNMGDPNSFINKVINIMGTAEQLDKLNPKSQIELLMRNKNGATGIGVYANTLSVRNVLSALDLPVAKKYQIKLIIDKLGENLDRQGNPEVVQEEVILNNFNVIKDAYGEETVDVHASKHVSLAVDNAKDPRMYYLNDNPLTWTATSYMLSMGMTARDAAVLRLQPMVWEVVQETLRTGGSVFDLKTAAVEKAKSYALKNGIDILSATDEKMIGFRDSFFNNLGSRVVKFQVELAASQIGSTLENQNNPNKAYGYLLGQMVAINNLLAMNNAGRDLQTLARIVVPDSKAELSTAESANEFFDAKYFLEQNDLDTFSVNAPDFVALLDGSKYQMVKGMHDVLTSTVNNMSTLFRQGSPLLSPMRVASANMDFGRQFFDKQGQQALSAFLLYNAMTSPGSPIRNLVTEENIERLLVSKETNFAKTLEETKLTNQEVATNLFFSRLSTSERISKLDKQIFLLDFNQNFIEGKISKDAVIQALESALNSVNPSIRALAKDAITVQLLSSGMDSIGFNNFIEFVPPSFWTGLKFTENYGTQQQVETDVESFIASRLQELTTSGLSAIPSGGMDNFVRIYGPRVKSLLKHIPLKTLPKKKGIRAGMQPSYEIGVLDDAAGRVVFNKIPITYFKTTNKSGELEMYKFNMGKSNETVLFYEKLNMTDDFKFLYLHNVLDSNGRQVEESVLPDRSAPGPMSPFTQASPEQLQAQYDQMTESTLNQYDRQAQSFMNMLTNESDSIDSTPIIGKSVSKPLKKGLPGVFNEELQQIGTEDQYSEYLDTVFPNSKVKEIVYRGVAKTRQQKAAANLGKGVYFAMEKEKAERYGDVTASIVNVQDPLIVNITKNDNRGFDPGNVSVKKATTNAENPSGKDAMVNYEYLAKNDYQEYNQYTGYYVGPLNVDGSPAQNEFKQTPYATELAVQSDAQVLELGSKKDIEGFKKFVSKPTSTVTVGSEQAPPSNAIPKGAINFGESVFGKTDENLDLLPKEDLIEILKGLTNNMAEVNKEAIMAEAEGMSQKDLAKMVEDMKKDEDITEDDCNSPL